MTNLSPKCSHDREKELEEEIESLRSSMAKLSRGLYLHQEMIFHHIRGFGKRGLGSFPEPNEGTKPSPEIKKCFIKELGSYCQHCEVTGHHTWECPLPTRPLPTLPTNYKSMFDGKHFLLSKIKGKVKARFIGKQAKEDKNKLPRQLWVPKALVTNV